MKTLKIGRILSLAIIAMATSASSARTADHSKPNVVLILADDLGYADLGCYGSQEVRTPNIDRLANEGVRLTDCYAFPVCSPSRAALITGQYPQRNGFDWVVRSQDKDLGLPVRGSSLPARLKKRGYATALFGKWHLGFKPEFGPNAHGFDRFFGFLSPDLDYYAHKDENGAPGLYEDTKLTQKAGYLTDLITERSVTYLKNAQQPFFLEVAYNAPHWPFQRPDNPNDQRTKKTYGLENGVRADYLTMVQRMDDGIGKLLHALDDSDRTRNTLVIFLSDNGGERLSDNGPLFHGKYSLWEGGIRVPCVARWPGVLPAKAVSSQMVIAMDLTASILAAAGAERQADNPIDGEDVLPILAGKSPPRERTFFWRLPRPDSKFGQKAVRRGNWKFIYDREVELLFDLSKDIGERRNLAYQHPQVVDSLRKAFIEWERNLPATPAK